MWPWSELPPPINIDGHQTLRLRDIRFSLTRLGWGLLIACLLLWIMAVNYQINVAYALVFWLIGILFFGAIAGLRQLTGLVLDIIPEAEYFAQKDVILTLRACDDCKRRRWLWLRTSLEDNHSAKDWQLWTITAESRDFRWQLPPQNRGYLPSLILAGASMAPFGLLMVEAQWKYTNKIIIFPAPLLHDLPIASVDHHDESIQISLSGENPAYLLPHQNTTPLKYIAWKHYAKSGNLLDKYFEQSGSAIEPTLISYRNYPPNIPKEKLASMLCYRVLSAEAGGKKYILELPHQRFEVRTAQRTYCLIALGIW
ncbi:MAG: hypothetical protein J6568_03575 [Snodgrassella sp.]|nr:hypothetical protein [Snodgrassella sp.]